MIDKVFKKLNVGMSQKFSKPKQRKKSILVKPKESKVSLKLSKELPI